MTEVQDVICQCINFLQKDGYIEKDLTLREAYNKYLHPDVLPIKDKKLWDAINSATILKEFQFDSQVGRQALKMAKPSNPVEMSNCNSAMRLMATEKGGETPLERIARMKNDMSLWYKEMNDFGVSREDQRTLEKYYLPTNGTPAQQEDLMTILMDPDVCGFSLKASNTARKICSKKKLDQVESLHKKVLEEAKNPTLGEYVWKTAIAPQLSYSFSRIHSTAYSFIGIQTVYLATYFPSVYWNTACLIVDSGLDEDASSNYAKLAKAIGNIRSKNIDVSLPDINKSQYWFKPDVDNNQILFGFKAASGVSADIVKDIIEHRPYSSVKDFIDKVNPNKTTMISLIKAGAFDQFGERVDIMEKYLWSACSPKKRLTLQNFAALADNDLLPEELSFQKRAFVYNKALKKSCKEKDGFSLKKPNFMKFYEKFFDEDQLEPVDDHMWISQKRWKKQYDGVMKVAKEYITEHQAELLEKINSAALQELWDKYAGGNYSSWEMEVLGMYHHPHELKDLDKWRYGVVEYRSLPEEPEVVKTFTGKNGRQYPIYNPVRIAGTVIAKDDMHSSISILTPESGVVNVKMPRDFFARINRRISEVAPDGTKTIVENSWTKKGTLCLLTGVRRGDTFMLKAYKKTPYHKFEHIDKVNPDGTIESRYTRYGEEEGEID